MSSFGRFPRDNRRYQHGRRNQNNGKEEIVEVPKGACGLIVGKGGRNIKEIQKMDGVHKVFVDFNNATVTIRGTDEGIMAVKCRIDKAVCIAVNSAAYFPEKALTCLRLGDGISEIKFRTVASFNIEATFGGVRLEQLDANREYSALCVNNSSMGSRSNDGAADREGIVCGYNEQLFMEFFSGCIQQNIAAILEPTACTEIGINFGKTFFSSIPDDAKDEEWLSRAELNGLKYGKNGIRPEYVRHLHTSYRDPFMTAILDDYYPISSGKYAVIHCISQEAKKRYTIKLKYRDGDEAPQEDSFFSGTATAVMEEIAQAKTYFEVLGVADDAITNSRVVDIAYQRRKLAIHPDNNKHPQAGQAMEVLNEARACLRDDQRREQYKNLPRSRQIPRSRFQLAKEVDHSEPLPDIQKFRSKSRKLGLLNVLDDASKSEFRTTIEIQKDEAALDTNMRRKLQEAWDSRSPDGKFKFPGGTDDWLIVETIRYKESETYSNGIFLLKIDEAIEEHFGKKMKGINVSLESEEVEDTLAMLQRAGDGSDKAPLIEVLLSCMRDLQNEAGRISDLLNCCF